MFKWIVFFILIVSCADSVVSEHLDIDANKATLPKEFPLEIGSAWVYQDFRYTDGVIDTLGFDTLFVFGTFKGFYLYSFNPNTQINLVQNADHKFINYGNIYRFMNGRVDTIYHQEPYIWSHFLTDSGRVEVEPGYNRYYDSMYVSITEKPYFGELKQTLIRSDYKDNIIREHEVTSDGIMRWSSRYKDSGKLYFESKIVSILKNTYPKSVLGKVFTREKVLFKPEYLSSSHYY